ncbi:motility associated factor glycosyltransferase family protein [Seleniivibrio woodruffii]|uniref:motility associated factor glycosyltransferase family protein n=1 Tax=Seleniivibrio woodruffii TaxID=1078050 RepID=UPI0026F07F13|nr:6-hydroxymethylpterin diphosphokinase MptE-like protein [Seleniivibrio woodruffii]
MGVRENNLKVLQERYPEIYGRIAAMPQNSNYEIVLPPREGLMPNMRSRKTGRSFYSSFNPMAEVEQDIRSRKLKVLQFNVFLGCGMMYQVFAMFRLFRIQGGLHVIIEKDVDAFRTMLNTVDITQMLNSPNMLFFVGEELPVIYARMVNVLTLTDSKFYIKTINFIEQPTAFSENKEYYLDAVRTMRSVIKELLNYFGNDPHDSMIGIEHTFVNIEEIFGNPGINQLKDVFKGRPGVVVATGPSLNKNVELLREIYDKAVIAGADASLRVLSKRGLKPHMVCSLERGVPTSQLFENLEEQAFEDVYFAAAPVVHPRTYSVYKGKRIVVYRNFATFKWLDIEKGILNIGPSSGNMAFKLLEYMGCDPIILIGQDLAFGEDGNTHASGNTFGEKEETNKNYMEQNVVMVEGNYVPQLRSTKVWNTFLNYYHKDVVGSPAKVINATEGGAKIHGTTLMTFREAIDKYIRDSFNPLEVINSTLKYPDELIQTAQRKSVLGKVDKGLDTCRRAIKTFQEGYDLAERYFNEIWIPSLNGVPYDADKGRALLVKMEDVNEIFKAPDFFNVLMHYVQSYTIRTLIEVNSIQNEDIPEEQSQFKIAHVFKDMYAVMIQLIMKMEQLLSSLKERLESNIKA